MSNQTGTSCSGRKSRRSSAWLGSEPLPERSCTNLDSTIKTVLRKAVRLRVDADKAHSNLLSRVKRLDEHLSKGTIPVGLRVTSIQAKGKNVETLQAKFEDIIREAEVKMQRLPSRISAPRLKTIRKTSASLLPTSMAP